MTVVGPHRDDLRLMSDGVELARHASRGQARLAALALRLAEARFLHDRRGEPPVLLLDDVLSELDKDRRRLVIEEACRYSQVLVTTTDPELVTPPDGHATHLLRIAGGQVIVDQAPGQERDDDDIR